MSNSTATSPLAQQSSAQSHQGLIEALACLSGFALVLAAWWSLNAFMAPTALNIVAMIAE